jgi:hypothetical protein
MLSGLPFSKDSFSFIFFRCPEMGLGVRSAIHTIPSLRSESEVARSHTRRIPSRAHTNVTSRFKCRVTAPLDACSRQKFSSILLNLSRSGLPLLASDCVDHCESPPAGDSPSLEGMCSNALWILLSPP